jgi:hypothetical protein
VFGDRLAQSAWFSAAVGWRYLDVNYRSDNNIFDVASSGLIFGATFDLK